MSAKMVAHYASAARRYGIVPLAAILAACSDVTDPAEPDPVAVVMVSPGELTLPAGATASIVATPLAADGAPLSGRTVRWSIADPAIAAVDELGTVTGIRPGITTVYATSEAKTGSARVSVAAPAPAVARVELSTTELDLEEGAARKIVASALDAAGQPVSGRGILWSTTDASVARVDADGMVAALRPGEVSVTARVDGVTASALVRVTANYPYDLVFDVSPAEHDPARELQRLDIRQPVPDPQQLLPPGALGWSAAVSPDGSRIAFIGVVHGWPGLHVMNRDGSGVRRLTTTAADAPDASPTWSPDGLRLAFERTSQASGADIWVIDAAGAQPPVNLTARLGMDLEQDPAWSSTGAIAFSRRTAGIHGIWVMNPDGSGLRRITDGASDLEPAWSPDGSMLVFIRLRAGSLGEPWLANAAGGGERPLGMALTGPQSAPAWSPDGSLIAFVSRHETYGTEGGNQVYTIGPDGTRLVRRTAGSADHADPVWMPRP